MTARSDSMHSGSVLLASRVVKSASLSFTVTVRAPSRSARRSDATFAARWRNAPAMWPMSRMSRSNVVSWLICLAGARASTGAAWMPRTRAHSHSALRRPSQRASVARSCGSTSSTRTRPSLASFSCILGPTPGKSPTLKPRRKSASPPGGTTNTPEPPTAAPTSAATAATSPLMPRRGFARSTAIFATSFDVPPPMEIHMPVSRCTASRIRCAVRSSGSWPYSASVPDMSRYHSSMLAPCTMGVNRTSVAAIAREVVPHALRGTGTHMASGHSRSACEMGIAERTPNARVSYEAEHTTPRDPGRPPTMSSGALPAPSGSAMRATATKNASASARRIRRSVTS